MSAELDIRRELAAEAARQAGEYLLKARNHLKVEEKGHGDWVTNADRHSQKLIMDLLGACFPQDSLVGEEGDAFDKDLAGLDSVWIIDPLDGTTNYVRGFAEFAVSIGYWRKGEPQIGVVFAPALDELFLAHQGKGAFLNGSPIKVSNTERLEDSLLATGFPYEADRVGEGNTDHVKNFIPRIQDLRRMGAAALDLANVAAGRLDGFWEYGLSPWDMAAGVVLVLEAGGQVSGLRAENYNLSNRRIVASNGLIHRQMLDVLAMGVTGLNPI